MERKELTKTYLMILNWKKHLWLTNSQRLQTPASDPDRNLDPSQIYLIAPWSETQLSYVV